MRTSSWMTSALSCGLSRFDVSFSRKAISWSGPWVGRGGACEVFALLSCTLMEFIESRHSLDPPKIKSMHLAGTGAAKHPRIRGILMSGLEGFLGARGGVTTYLMDPLQILSSPKIISILFLGAGGGELGFCSSEGLSLFPWDRFFFFGSGFGEESSSSPTSEDFSGSANFLGLILFRNLHSSIECPLFLWWEQNFVSS